MMFVLVSMPFQAPAIWHVSTADRLADLTR